MTTSSIPPNLRQLSPNWNQLPSEVGVTVFEKVITSAEDEAKQRNPSLTPEQAALASARALAKLPSLSKAFREWHEQTLALHPDAGMAATRHAINSMARNLGEEEFGQGMDGLLARNRDVFIDLLSPRQCQIVLEKLSEHTASPLHNVTLNFSRPRFGGGGRLTIEQLENVRDALSRMRRNHPELQIRLNLSNQFLGVGHATPAVSAALITDVIRQPGLISLNLTSNYLGDEVVNAIAQTLPESTVIDLNLEVNLIDKSAKALIKALPKSEVINLGLRCNRLGVDEAQVFSEILAQPDSKKMISVDLSLNRIEIEGVKAILDVLPLQTEMDRLNLSGTFINPADDNTVKAIVNAILQPKMVDLDVSRNNFSSEGEQAIRTACLEAQRSKAIKVRIGDD